jgi:hypothetical protein
MVDERDHSGPILLEGVDHLNDRWGLALACCPVFVLFGVHSAYFNDAQANVDDIMLSHQVSRRTCVGCADEEACREGLKAVSGMPFGGHPLPICFAIFGRGFAVLLNEPLEHVEKYRVWVLHPDRLVCLLNCLGKICEENIGKGRIHRDDICSCFLVKGVCGFEALALVVRGAGREVWDCVNFFRKWKKNLTGTFHS